MRTIGIGAEAGYAGDRIEPAVALARHGCLDDLRFECFAERMIALARQARLADPHEGYDILPEQRVPAALPTCRAGGARIVTHMGAANPLAAAQRVRDIARSLARDAHGKALSSAPLDLDLPTPPRCGDGTA
ncbi:acyclic terpene utilization AtuA family protein [Bosea sp. LjRoot9]|uniref:acyclic terpene utilization AtuA family protein n=1 Tax=Bosea sp. LjRoot9 TaxID=3342341 RepID=UPI003ED12789